MKKGIGKDVTVGRWGEELWNVTAIVIQIHSSWDICTVSINNQVWMEEVFKGTPFSTADLFLCYWFRREVIALSCAHRWPQQTSMCSYNPTVTHIIQVNLSRSHNKTKSYKSGTQTGRKGGNWQKHKGDTRMMRQESKSRHILRSIAADSSSQLTQFLDQSLPLHSFPLCSKKHTYTHKNNRVLHDTVVLWTSWPGNGNLIFVSFCISF